MIYQHPLAYLLGIEGLALLSGWAGDYDQGFVERRLAEVRRLLADEALANHPGVLVEQVDTKTESEQWALTYDEGRNGLFDADEPIMYEILDAQPVGTALDAACGTGRYADHLASRGHRVIGIDSSPDMLAKARVRVPVAQFALGDLHRLPLRDDTVDTVVCGLALTHVAELEPVFAEFARVLRTGGHLVISDVHPELVFRGSVPAAISAAGTPLIVEAHRHSSGTFLRAALKLGFAVRRCEEPRLPAADAAPVSPEIIVGDWDTWPWSLMALLPEAMQAAGDHPPVIIWDFERD